MERAFEELFQILSEILPRRKPSTEDSYGENSNFSSSFSIAFLRVFGYDIQDFLPVMATWPSGKAGACKAFIGGSSPPVASIFLIFG